MDRIIWDESFSVNVSEIDHQHKKLLEMANELHTAIMERKDEDLLGKIVSGLISYTETHFKTEEKYFDLLGYPEKKEHIEEHKSFIKKISEIIDELGAGKRTLSRDVLEFISEWLETHIKGTDKNYSLFFNENGLL